jgi:electron transfer flavoprotein alpha subunit
MSKGILVFIEHKGGAANKSSIEALAAAQKLGSELQQRVTALVLGSDVSGLAQEIAAYDVEKVICATNEKLADYTPDAYADGFEQIVKQTDPNFVFLTHTYQVRDFAPKLAATAFARALKAASSVLRAESFSASSMLTSSRMVKRRCLRRFRPELIARTRRRREAVRPWRTWR